MTEPLSGEQLRTLRELARATPGQVVTADFGHRPITINQGMCGGCEHCPDEEREVCARCHHVTREWGEIWDFDGSGTPIPAAGWRYEGHTIDWPCASAVALGIADQEEYEL